MTGRNFFQVFFIFSCLFSGIFPVAVKAAPIGIALDFLTMELESFPEVSQKTISSLTDNTMIQFENIYAIIDAEQTGPVDLNNPDALTNLVDEMYEHPIIKSRIGLISSLSGVSQVIDTGLAIAAVVQLGEIISSVAKDLPEAAQEFSELMKGEKRSVVLKNLLLFGSGRRNGKLQAMLNAIDAEKFIHISIIAKKINDVYFSGNTEKAAKAFEALLYLIQKEVADEQAENLRNGVWAKMTIQDFIVKKWKEAGIIDDSSYEKFQNLNVYSKDKTGIIFYKPLVKKTLKARDYYALITNADLAEPEEPIYDFQIEIDRTALNLYRIAVPSEIVNHSEFGRPISISFSCNNIDLLNDYPDAVSSRVNIAGTQIPQSFVFDLSKYQELKSSASIAVTVDYGENRYKRSYDYLLFYPQITSVNVISPPAQWTSTQFPLTVKICGDETKTVYVQYKEAGSISYKSDPFKLSDPATVDGNCRTYTITVDGWNMLFSFGGGKDIVLRLKAEGVATSGAEYSEIITRNIVNLHDLDNDELPDSWEVQFFGDRFAQAAAGDPDGDGADNLFEYQWGTDPTKAGAAGVIETRVFQPVQYLSGDWQYDFSLSGIYWSNILQQGTNLTIYDDEVLVNGNFVLESGTLDLNGRTLTIMGNFLQSGGVLNVNGGKLIVKGDYRIQGKNSDGSYGCCSAGMLRMANDADHIQVDGDFVMDSMYPHDGRLYLETALLSAGTLEVKGNFSQQTTYGPIGNWACDSNFKAQGTHKVLLSGSGPQVVSFSTPSYEMSHFNILEITNPDSTKITFNPCWPAMIYSGGALPLGDLKIGTVDLTLPMDMKIKPSNSTAFELYGATLNLNGHTLTVEGDFLQSGGLLNVNGGKLIVKGDYRIQGKNSDGSYSYSTGMLRMVNDADHIQVDGDFVMDSMYPHDGRLYLETALLSAGTLEVKGNFSQQTTYGPIGNWACDSNFKAQGTHKVLLSGSGPQVVSFSTPSYEMSHFNELLLNGQGATTFSSAVAVTKLFNHQRKPFTLSNPEQSSFVDYDGDKVQDHLDAYPLDPNQSVFDRDGDGVADNDDAFPDDPKESADTDHDGIGNNADTDDDNDGVADSKDAFPLDASEWRDTDGDGNGDNADNDDDNDGVTDTSDNCPLVANQQQEDNDNDGIGDACEIVPEAAKALPAILHLLLRK